MSDIKVKLKNAIHMTIDCDRGISQELSDYFSFRPPNFLHHPKFKARLWDGYIRLYSHNNPVMYIGLLHNLQEFAKERGYTIKIDKSVFYGDTVADDVAVKIAEEFGCPLIPHDYQQKYIADAIRDGRSLNLSPTSCHAKGDKIFMANGNWKNVEDVTIGDMIIGADGKPKEVLKTFTGTDKLYKINPTGLKSSITVTGSHILPIKFSDSKKKNGYASGNPESVSYITVDDYIKKSKYYKHCSNIFYNSNVIEYENVIDTKLTPYFIGLYLGDGSSHACGITNIDEEPIKEIYYQASLLNMNVVKKDKYTYNIIGKENNRNIIFECFEKLGITFGNVQNRTKCEARRIPNIILKSNSNFRKEFLAGLIDSDGHLNKTYYEFIFKSEQMAKDVYTLSLSLGLIPKISKKNVNGVVYYRVSISGNIHIIPTRIKRKIAKNIRTRNPYNSKFTVEYKEVGEYYGFEVEDHLYITNGGMVTHNSGKSLIQYLLTMYYLGQYGGRVLIIVPRLQLTQQMRKDFVEYNCDPGIIGVMGDGVKKDPLTPIVISTWQTLVKLDKKFFDTFNVVMGDEAHTFESKSLTEIMTKLDECYFRHGFTGTISTESKIHRLVLEGMFGRLRKYVSTSELIENKVTADFKVKALLLNYSDEDKKQYRELMKNVTEGKKKYPLEKKFIKENLNRNIFIRNLVWSLKDQNNLILFDDVDTHGKVIADMLQQEGRIVFFIHGGVKVEERERMREAIEKDPLKRYDIVASSGTTSTGVSIKRIDNAIFTMGTKGEVKTLQSIGRLLRKGNGSDDTTLFDIGDKISNNVAQPNYSFTHFSRRMEIYNEEQFNYKIYKVDM